MISRINPADFPHLSEFARGYLHQDVVPEYESVLKAAEAYLRDLTPQERKQVAEEAARFRTLAQKWTTADRTAAFAALGASWTPLSADSLNTLLHALEATTCL